VWWTRTHDLKAPPRGTYRHSRQIYLLQSTFVRYFTWIFWSTNSNVTEFFCPVALFLGGYRDLRFSARFPKSRPRKIPGTNKSVPQIWWTDASGRTGWSVSIALLERAWPVCPPYGPNQTRQDPMSRPTRDALRPSKKKGLFDRWDVP
jgi:hypothetical protein